MPEVELFDKLDEFKSDFKGVGGETTPRWVAVKALKEDVASYSEGKFETGLDLDYRV